MCLGPIDHFFTQNTSVSAQIETIIKRPGRIVHDGISVALPNPVASIVKVPPTQPATPSNITFSELPCSPENVQKITRLISVIGENGKFVLLFKYQKELRQIVHDGISVALPNPIASIVKVPPTQPTTPSNVTFAELPCSPEDVQKITRLISVIGENGKFVLLFKYQKELRQIGREIEHVHPLKMISVIMANPHLKSCMKEMHSDYFKWSNFMDGVGNALTSNHKQGNVVPYLDDFAKACGVTVSSLKNFIDNQDWENMLINMINT